MIALAVGAAAVALAVCGLNLEMHRGELARLEALAAWAICFGVGLALAVRG